MSQQNTEFSKRRLSARGLLLMTGISALGAFGLYKGHQVVGPIVNERVSEGVENIQITLDNIRQVARTWIHTDAERREAAIRLREYSERNSLRLYDLDMVAGINPADSLQEKADKYEAFLKTENGVPVSNLEMTHSGEY